MGARRILATIIGVAQGAMGALALVLVCMLYLKFPSAQIILNVSDELLPISLLVLSIFSFFSISSGFFLAVEGLRGD